MSAVEVILAAIGAGTIGLLAVGAVYGLYQSFTTVRVHPHRDGPAYTWACICGATSGGPWSPEHTKATATEHRREHIDAGDFQGITITPAGAHKP